MMTTPDHPVTTPELPRLARVALKALLSLSLGISLLSLLALLTACASTTPEYDKRFGDAVRQARSQSTLNPKAGENPDPVSGMDGASARRAIGRYQAGTKGTAP
jgi:hypothetical protein